MLCSLPCVLQLKANAGLGVRIVGGIGCVLQVASTPLPTHWFQEYASDLTLSCLEQIDHKGDSLVVREVLQGGPAEKQGIIPGIHVCSKREMRVPAAVHRCVVREARPRYIGLIFLFNPNSYTSCLEPNRRCCHGHRWLRSEQSSGALLQWCNCAGVQCALHASACAPRATCVH